MTFSPPPEAAHFRGNTLTPESPRPVHIPEPSNIPVLEKQIDPVFNLMSTHMEAPHALRDLTAMDHAMSGTGPSPISTFHSEGGGNSTLEARGTDPNAARDEQAYAMSFGSLNGSENNKQANSSTIQTQSPSFTVQPATSVASHDISPLLSQPKASPTPFTYSTHDHPAQYNANPLDPSQDDSQAQSHDTTFHEAISNPNRMDDLTAQAEEKTDEDVLNEGVNYQTLLDNLSPPSTTAPSADHNFLTTSASPGLPTDLALEPRSSSVQSPVNAAPPPAGLPPRPPPQDKPAIHHNYTPDEDIRSYHYPHIPNTTAHSSQSSRQNASYRPSPAIPHSLVAAGAPGTSSTPNGLPPPPLATFQQSSKNQDQASYSPATQQFRQRENTGRNETRSDTPANGDDDEAPWGPEIQSKYDDFLRDERVYVTEGLWDRFPQGSRLFVGNLPTEKVTKRDLFHVFHKYGKLAQVSIKQAYGFVQYLDSPNCVRALQMEQGNAIRGRKMHLEISKPQKNSRNATSTAAGDRLRANHGRRSRSPDHGRGSNARGAGQRMGGDRVDRGVPFSDFRDEPRRRDDYRPIRSPSPRGFRRRDEYRGGGRSDRYYEGRHSRSRSPYGRRGWRSPSPRRRSLDEDAALPIPRRDPRDVPDVQLIVVDELDRGFVGYIEKSFRDRGLRCDILFLPRVSLEAVVKRQIIEGVQAVVKLYRSSQITGKIPLQVFDRNTGADNARFDEYEDLDAHIAAELVLRAKSAHAAPGPPQVQFPASHQAYVNPQYAQPPQQYTHPQQQQQQPPVPQADLANSISSLDGTSLRKLLGAITQNSQPQQAPQTPQQHVPQSQVSAQTPDLAALLNSVTRQQPPQQHGYQYPPQQTQHQQSPSNPYGALAANPAFAGNPALASLLGNAGNRPPQQGVPSQQQQAQPTQQQHVQNIMEQLAKWKQ